jgi:hypothetical protein
MHRHHSIITLLAAAIVFFFTLAGCRSPQFGGEITISLSADGQTRDARITSGSTVLQALQQLGIAVGELDRAEPAFYTVLRTGDAVKLVRVREEFQSELVTVPYEKQTIRNETMPVGDTRMVQPGVNGQNEITYRRILEDGMETARTVVKTVVLQESSPEIVMVGAQASFTPLTIPGTLVYLAAGNAWLMDGSTANRRLIVSTGDLDGRVFGLSPTGEYLVFTRKSKKPADQEINTLWVVRTGNTTPKPQYLNARNVIHFAAWIPGTNSVAFSTAEPRATSPGWQANNDLWRVSITGGSPRKLLDANSGGVYGWWGMSFSYSADGRLAYSRPDGIGLVDQDGGYLKPLMEITPFNSHSDWAWIPGIAWGPDGKTLFVTSHAVAPSPITDEESPYFDLSALSLENNATAALARQTGMFSYPSASPVRQTGTEGFYKIAYLQAIFPDQSESSRYRLMVMDRDGSDRQALFPAQDVGGIEPQAPMWAPEPIPGQAGDFIGIIYQGNLWLVDSGSAQAYQVTGDSLIKEIDWK